MVYTKVKPWPKGVVVEKPVVEKVVAEPEEVDDSLTASSHNLREVEFYAIRITGFDDGIKKVIDKFRVGGEPYVIGHEVGHGTGKAHVHIVMGMDKSPDNLRMTLRRLGVKGNGRFTVKKCWDVEGAIAYACKDGDVSQFECCKETLDEYIQLGQVRMKEKELRKEKKKGDFYGKLLEEIKEKEYEFYRDENKIFEMVYHRCACPTNHLLMSYMRKIERDIDGDNGCARVYQWYVANK